MPLEVALRRKAAVSLETPAMGSKSEMMHPFQFLVGTLPYDGQEFSERLSQWGPNPFWTEARSPW